MGAQYLIDSNAIIDYLGGKLPSSGMMFMDGVINATPKISVISKIEVLSFNAPPSDYQLLSDFMNDSDILDLTETVVEKTIDLRKQYRVKLPDAIIAATALVHGLELISRNINDFKTITGIKVLDPHSI